MSALGEELAAVGERFQIEELIDKAASAKGGWQLGERDHSLFEVKGRLAGLMKVWAGQFDQAHRPCC